MYIYYCMTGRAVQGNFLFEISPTDVRDDTEVKNGIFPRITRDFRVTIGTGNNGRAILGNIAL